MAHEALVVDGVVRNSVVVPQPGARLSEGTHVRILVPGPSMPPALRAELEAWDRASEESWGLIDDLEREGQE